MNVRAWWLLCLLPTWVQAAGPLPPLHDDKVLDFSLRMARVKSEFHYDTATADTTGKWLGLSVREKFSPHLTLGMFGGYAYVTQTRHPLTAGIELDGYHAGFSLHAVMIETPRVTLYGAMDYTYQKVDHKSDTQTVVIDWSEPHAQLGVIVPLAKRLRFFGGGNYGYIDGEERASGTTNHTVGFKQDARAGGFVGLDLQTDIDGYVGLEAKSGLARSAEIYFKRRY
jgi:hypothetical protein